MIFIGAVRLIGGTLSEWVCCPPEKNPVRLDICKCGGFSEETFSEEISQKIFPGNLRKKIYRKIFQEDFPAMAAEKISRKFSCFRLGSFLEEYFFGRFSAEIRQIFRRFLNCFSAGKQSENMRKIPVRCDLSEGKRSEDFPSWVSSQKKKIGRFAERRKTKIRKCETLKLRSLGRFL